MSVPTPGARAGGEGNSLSPNLRAAWLLVSPKYRVNGIVTLNLCTWFGPRLSKLWF